MAAEKRASENTETQRPQRTTMQKVLREVLSWVWLLLALFVVEGAVAQSRLIPSGSMENTILVGDHIVVSPFGYSLCVPYTELHVPLWRNPKRQQIIILQSPVNGTEDLIKRVIGIPGDRIQIEHGLVYVNGKKLKEPYVLRDPSDSDGALENFPPTGDPLFQNGLTPQWAATMHKYVVNGQIVVPSGDYFVMGDNRGDSYDSRFWGFVPRRNIIAEPLFIFMSINASEDAWQPGHVGERIDAYLNIFLHPSEVRWGRLFHTL